MRLHGLQDKPRRRLTVKDELVGRFGSDANPCEKIRRQPKQFQHTGMDQFHILHPEEPAAHARLIRKKKQFPILIAGTLENGGGCWDELNFLRTMQIVFVSDDRSIAIKK